jgi:hypothetical protein
VTLVTAKQPRMHVSITPGRRHAQEIVMRTRNIALRNVIAPTDITGSDQSGLRRGLDHDRAPGEWLARRRAELALLTSILAAGQHP